MCVLGASSDTASINLTTTALESMRSRHDGALESLADSLWGNTSPRFQLSMEDSVTGFLSVSS